MSAEELDAIRERQKERGEKPRYPGTWRDRTDHPEGQPFVIRFKNPLDGKVVINDHVRGKIEISNTELDDLIIQRTDGTPTYNFCVVVDDCGRPTTSTLTETSRKARNKVGCIDFHSSEIGTLEHHSHGLHCIERHVAAIHDIQIPHS